MALVHFFRGILQSTTTQSDAVTVSTVQCSVTALNTLRFNCRQHLCPSLNWNTGPRRLAFTFGTAREEWTGCPHDQIHTDCTECKDTATKGQCRPTNYHTALVYNDLSVKRSHYTLRSWICSTIAIYTWNIVGYFSAAADFVLCVPCVRTAVDSSDGLDSSEARRFRAGGLSSREFDRSTRGCHFGIPKSALGGAGKWLMRGWRRRCDVTTDQILWR